jgi:uncharacterized protein (DUF1499 family)
MTSVGVILNDTDVSQLNWRIISEMNNLNQSSNRNYTIYYCNSSPICVNNFCAINKLHDIHKVSNGVLIATSLDSALFLIKSQTKARKVFFVWDLEFIHNKNTNYLYARSIMENIELWTRSESYADIIENYCDIRPKISNDSIKEILNV